MYDVKWPLNIHFSECGLLNPMDDITPKEAVQLCMMLVSGFHGAFADFKKFVEDHSLQRHFSSEAA